MLFDVESIGFVLGWTLLSFLGWNGILLDSFSYRASATSLGPGKSKVVARKDKDSEDGRRYCLGT